MIDEGDIAPFGGGSTAQPAASSASTTTTASTTTATVTSTKASCAVEQFKGDGYCDDGNNVAACDFDGGDCCNNKGSNWNHFCKARTFTLMLSLSL